MKKENILISLAITLSLLCGLALTANITRANSILVNEAPSEEVIKQLLTDKFTSNTYATRKETLEFESIEFSQPNQGVYPVRIKCTRIIKDSDGTSKKFAIDGLFHFLKDNNNEWTFNVQEWYRNEQISD